MSNQLYLGIDMGGTNVKIAVVNAYGDIIEEVVMKTAVDAKPIAAVLAIVRKAKEFKNYSKTKTIGIGIAGDIDFIRGKVRFSPNLYMWKNVALKSMIERLTRKKTLVDNDANTAALGAFWLDAKAKYDSLVCITLGTGVGGGIILDKKIYRGASGSAGEIGHITIDPFGKKCNCGNTGCAETYIGANYVSEYACKYLETHMSPIIENLVKDNNSKITPELLFTAAKKGDKSAVEIWNYVGGKLGVLLSDVINFINPESIILCGGVSGAGKFIINPAKEEIAKRAFKSAAKTCKIAVSKYTQKLGVVGAAMLAKQ
ncbi:MAG: ROK family protein [Endomicrobium sp.]|nr:ROK family protein [Endomicrobium sp.]